MNVFCTEQNSSNTEFSIQINTCFKIHRKMYLHMCKYLVCPEEKMSISASVKSTLSLEYLIACKGNKISCCSIPVWFLGIYSAGQNSTV